MTAAGTLTGPHSAWLDELALPQPYAGKLASLRDIAGGLSDEITLLDTVIADLLAQHDAYHALQQLPGIGKVLAAVIVAEIGDITRFASPARLCSWVDLTPRHRESDVKVARGHITKQESRPLRWPWSRPSSARADPYLPCAAPTGSLKSFESWVS